MQSLLERVSLEVLTNSSMVGILYLTVQGVLQFLNSWVLLDIVYKTGNLIDIIYYEHCRMSFSVAVRSAFKRINSSTVKSRRGNRNCTATIVFLCTYTKCYNLRNRREVVEIFMLFPA